MDRRGFVRMGAAAGAAGTVINPLAVRAADAASNRASMRLGASSLLDGGVRQQQQLMAANKLTSHALTSQYLARIRSIDKSGPRLNAIIEVNPEALKIAREMDRERLQRRVRGPLHGIPVLLKDNIATADRMGTTAGSLALAGVRTARDAHIVERLRAAGACLLYTSPSPRDS